MNTNKSYEIVCNLKAINDILERTVKLIGQVEQVKDNINAIHAQVISYSIGNDFWIVIKALWWRTTIFWHGNSFLFVWFENVIIII